MHSAMEIIQKIRGQRIPGTPAENIVHIEINGSTVKAVFTDETQAREYFTKYTIKDSCLCNFNDCDFSLNRNKIEAISKCDLLTFQKN